MKEFVVITTHYRNIKNAEFDNENEAIKEANKRQKTRKFSVLVLRKIDENERETLYKEFYNAQGGKLSGSTYGFLKLW